VSASESPLRTLRISSRSGSRYVQQACCTLSVQRELQARACSASCRSFRFRVSWSRQRAPIFNLTDSANHLSEKDDWVGPGKYPTIHSSKDGDIVRGVLELLHHRVNLGFPTFFVKVREHREGNHTTRPLIE